MSEIQTRPTPPALTANRESGVLIQLEKGFSAASLGCRSCQRMLLACIFSGQTRITIPDSSISSPKNKFWPQSELVVVTATTSTPHVIAQIEPPGTTYAHLGRKNPGLQSPVRGIPHAPTASPKVRRITYSPARNKSC